ncbi:LOW QUALITY PROTEIN: hypothetical protein Fmac_005776 [Flemingia macrophylla]|uniref:Large ribosomal subunit protein uL4 C-terminal domain-containing protein n=1 Tax=Flemingia macrophylla TaxID=520843 RepID=A0ABD1N987_9FABA
MQRFSKKKEKGNVEKTRLFCSRHFLGERSWRKFLNECLPHCISPSPPPCLSWEPPPQQLRLDNILDIMCSSIRPDIINFVHSNISRNSSLCRHRCVGHQTSAESWGTGRAISRIPHVLSDDTHRTGQGAFGNMCRSGRMFAPTKIWRRWHRKINVNQNCYTMVSAIAAFTIPSLVLARDNRVESVPKLLLIISDFINDVEKTKEAIKVLKQIGAYLDVEKAKDNHGIRPSKGKMHNRHYISRKGPLIVYGTKGAKVIKAFRNVLGVEVANVEKLNLLKLAPGEAPWKTKSAFEKLDFVYGSFDKPSEKKKGYVLPRLKMVNSYLARIINSDEVHSIVRLDYKRATLKKNPLSMSAIGSMSN